MKTLRERLAELWALGELRLPSPRDERGRYYMDDEIPLKPEWRSILELRSVKDKLGIAIDCDVADPADIPIISELVREGIIVWIDRACLPIVAVSKETGMPRFGINSDIYQLTLKGIRLCNEHGIRRQ